MFISLLCAERVSPNFEAGPVFSAFLEQCTSLSVLRQTMKRQMCTFPLFALRTSGQVLTQDEPQSTRRRQQQIVWLSIPLANSAIAQAASLVISDRNLSMVNNSRQDECGLTFSAAALS